MAFGNESWTNIFEKSICYGSKQRLSYIIIQPLLHEVALHTASRLSICPVVCLYRYLVSAANSRTKRSKSPKLRERLSMSQYDSPCQGRKATESLDTKSINVITTKRKAVYRLNLGRHMKLLHLHVDCSARVISIQKWNQVKGQGHELIVHYIRLMAYVQNNFKYQWRKNNIRVWMPSTETIKYSI